MDTIFKCVNQIQFIKALEEFWGWSGMTRMCSCFSIMSLNRKITFLWKIYHYFSNYLTSYLYQLTYLLTLRTYFPILLNYVKVIWIYYTLHVLKFTLLVKIQEKGHLFKCQLTKIQQNSRKCKNEIISTFFIALLLKNLGYRPLNDK